MQPLAEQAPARGGAPASVPARAWWLGPAVVTAALAALNVAFLVKGRATFGSDEAMYVRAALRLRAVYALEAAPRFATFFDVLGSRQPLPAWVGGWFELLPGDVGMLARLSNVVPLAVLCFATWALARRLGGTRAGVSAALLTALYPPLLHLSRVYWAHFWLVAAVAVALLALERARGLPTRGSAALVGLALAAGLLTRHFFVVFMAVPVVLFLVELWPVWQRGTRAERARLQGRLGLVTGIVVALALPHYAYAWSGIRKTMKAAAGGLTSCYVPSDNPVVNWLWFPAKLFTAGSMPFGLVLLALAVFAALAARDRAVRLLVGAGLGGLVLANGYSCKVLEYALPVVPPLVAAGVGLAWARNGALGRAVRVASVGAIALGALFAVNDLVPLLDATRASGAVAASLLAEPRRPAPPDPNDTATFELGRVIASRWRELGRRERPRVELVADYPMETNRVDLALAAAGAERDGGGWYARRPGKPARVDVPRLLGADFLVLTDHDNGSDVWLWQVQHALKPALVALAARAPGRLQNFVLRRELASTPAPTRLYEKVREPTGDDVAALLAVALDTVDRGRFPDLAVSLASELAVRASSHGGDAALAQRALARVDELAGPPGWAARVRCWCDAVRDGAPVDGVVADLAAVADGKPRAAPRCD